MKTRYKTGKFNQPISVVPGDTINLILTESSGREQKITEEISITTTVTHWVMFHVPGVGFGGLLGGPDLVAKMSEIFVEPVLIYDDDILIG